MLASSNLIQSLWIGPTLSTMEQLCIVSFLRQGHTFHLYAYDGPPVGLPAGVVVRDASEILPRSAVFKYQNRDTYAGFSNLFRYKLLLDQGGIWVDMDMVCLAPFSFPQDYVFIEQGKDEITNCMIKAPAGSEVIRNCYRCATDKGVVSVRWGETGPKLLEAAVKHSQLLDHVMGAEKFCPVSYSEYKLLVQENSGELLQSRMRGALAVHLWNEMWRLDELDKDAQYSETSLYEILKQRYLPNYSTPKTQGSASSVRQTLASRTRRIFV